MLATKPLLTKSPIVWRATLQQSKLFRTLYFAVLLLSIAALAQCAIDWQYRSALVLVTSFGGVLIYVNTLQTSHLAFLEDKSWQFDDGNFIHVGQLAAGSYRSMLVVVVAIKPETGWTRHAVVWRDAVDPHTFSALHIRLALCTAEQLQ